MKTRLQSFIQNLRFLLSLTFRVDRRLFLINLFLFLALAVLPLASLWLLKVMVDRVLETRSITHSYVLWAFSGLVVVQILQHFIQHWTQYFQQKQQQQLSEYITLRVLDKAGSISYSYYENPAFYDALHMAQQQSAYLPPLIIQQVQTVLQQLISAMAVTAFLVSLHWSLPIFLLLLGLPLAISRLVYGEKQFQLEKQILPEQRKAFDLYTYLTGLPYAKEVRVFGLGPFFTGRYHAVMQSIFRQRDQLHFIHMRKGMLASVFEVLFVAAFYLLLIGRAISGAVSIGGLIVYFQAFQRLQSSIQTIFKSAVSIFQHQLYLKEIMEYLALPASDQGVAATNATGPEVFNDISVRKLDFHYPGTERQVLKQVSLRFPRGKVVAVVGENGSGKSTLIKILCGLYTPDRGQVFFGDTDAADLSPSFYRTAVSAVFQDFSRYHLSIAENIAIGQEQVDRKRVEESLIAARGDEILNLPGFTIDTGLGRTYRHGEELSGGQWQKVAIARALYRNHDVIVLDEPTSAIDAESESAIFNHLRANAANRIVILVTHRLYNLKMADMIYVMKDFEVVQQGNFEELINTDGPFRTYYNVQRI